MSNRRDQLTGDVFGDSHPAPSPDLSAVDEAVYGPLQGVDNNRIVAEARSIYKISPDPQQPRRTIPSKVRVEGGWHSEPWRHVESMAAFFEAWRWLANQNFYESVDIHQLLAKGIPETFAELDVALYSEMAALVKVVSLAISIKQHGGLINPITVSRTGRDFKINTGERRWLAYHLLNSIYHGDKWQMIPSQVVEDDVWSQAAENQEREDLNGIEQARQFSILLMSLYPEQDWGNIGDFIDEDGCDRAFYAQMADGDEWRVPYGSSDKIAGAMGVSPTTLRRYRLILSLPDDYWLKADDEGWSAYAIQQWIIEQKKPKQGKSVATATVSEGMSPDADKSTAPNDAVDRSHAVGAAQQDTPGKSVATATGSAEPLPDEDKSTAPNDAVDDNRTVTITLNGQTVGEAELPSGPVRMGDDNRFVVERSAGESSGPVVDDVAISDLVEGIHVQLEDLRGMVEAAPDRDVQMYIETLDGVIAHVADIQVGLTERQRDEDFQLPE